MGIIYAKCMNELFLTIIAALLATNGYFVKQIFDRLAIIKEDVADMKPKVSVLWADTRPKVDFLWSDIKTKVDLLWTDKYAPARSPRQLNERGSAIFKESGIKEIVDGRKLKLLEIVKSKNLRNPYDAEQFIVQLMSELPSRYPELVDTLKDGAFRTGVDINTVLFIGSIYLRDLIFPELGFGVNG